MNLDSVLRHRLPLVIEHYQTVFKLSLQNAETLFSDVQLFLCIVYMEKSKPNKVSPTDMIHRGWIEFILCTEQYISFCGLHFGEIIHHTPFPKEKRLEYSRIAEIRRAARLAQNLLKETKTSRNWAPPPYVKSQKLPVRRV